MPRQTLTLDTIGDVEHGTLRIAVNKALKLITQDLHDRPLLEKARKVQLTIEMKPEVDANSQSRELEDVKTAWQVKVTTPSIGSSDVQMKPGQDGQLYFHSELPMEPDESDLNDELERKRRENR